MLAPKLWKRHRSKPNRPTCCFHFLLWPWFWGPSKSIKTWFCVVRPNSSSGYTQLPSHLQLSNASRRWSKRPQSYKWKFLWLIDIKYLWMAYYAFDSFGIFGEWNTLEIQPFFWYTNPFPLPPMCWGWYIDTVGRAFCSCASHNLWWRWIWGGDYLPQKVQIFRPPIGVAFPLQGNVKMPTSQR